MMNGRRLRRRDRRTVTFTPPAQTAYQAAMTDAPPYFVIAVDGTAASGKGTIAGMLAEHYGLPHLDTGLLYRAVGQAVRMGGGDPGDEESAATAARALDISKLGDPALQSGEAGEAASRVAAHPAVRAALLTLQQDFARQPGGAVLDGRDIGTVIATDAPAKLFIDAALETRARRRWRQTSAKGDPRTLEEMIEDLRRRDARDSGRTAAPLVRAGDSVLLDTTEMDISTADDAARRIVEAARVRWLETQRSG
jgi:cytidylate kinase